MDYRISLIFLTIIYFIISDAEVIKRPFETISGKKLSPHENGRYVNGDKSFVVGVTGGKESTINKHKHIAALYYEKDFEGSAVIIGKKWLLTAAWNIYWVDEGKNTVRIGSSYAFKGGKVYKVENFTVYPNYDDEWIYDIAVVKLTSNIKFSKNVKAISLASQLPNNGTKVVVSGWGWDLTSLPGTKVLKEATVDFLDYKSCKPHYDDIDSFTDYSFCTVRPGVGPCAKDFGSPLVYNNKLIGIYSGAFECGGTTYPAVYADITKYKKWIEDVIKSDSEHNEGDENLFENEENL